MVVSEMDEAATLRRLLGLHPGLVYIKNPSAGRGVRQWVLADREACDSAAELVWRGVTVVSAGPVQVMVAGRGKHHAPVPDGAWSPSSAERVGTVVEVWENKSLVRSTICGTVAELRHTLRFTYDEIGADAD